MRTLAGIKIYEVPDIAAALGVHPVTARKYLSEGRIKGRKIGREWNVTEADLLAFFNGGVSAPGAELPKEISGAAK